MNIAAILADPDYPELKNYILDQTNVYASARKRKMRHFLGFKRVCAILQPEDEELKRREWKRTFEDGEDAVNLFL